MPESEKSKSLRIKIPTADYPVTLKQRVYSVLDRFPNAKPIELCKLLGIDYKYYAPSVSVYKHLWKEHQLRFRQGLNCLSFHAHKVFGYSPKFLDRRLKGVTESALSMGWIQTKMRNRAILWTEPNLGRLLWFETGRITGQIKKPVSKAKILQLLACAFCWTALIKDVTVFEAWARAFHLKGAHLVYDTGEELPYAKIDLLKESNGIIVTVGDKSHRTGVEVEFVYPDWLERLELLTGQNIKTIESFNAFLKDLSKPKPLPKNDMVA